jgi:CMP-N-acetylneuraminic acid synthetase/2-polyprenyl-3-methyl-5-hydroxy-6-metoxy-1,4-benzoquinol methylase
VKKIKNLIFLPARSKSKRVYDKNVRTLCGKPLLYYQLTEATKIKNKHVVLSTDSKKYYNLGKNFYKKLILHNRPKKLSGDKIKTESAVLDYLKLAEKKKIIYQNVIILQITSPLNEARFIERGIKKLEKNKKLNSIATYTEDKSFFLDQVDKELFNRDMTQFKKPRKKETGNFWITKIDCFKKKSNRLVTPVGLLKVPKELSYEIDDNLDIKIISALLESKVYEKENLYFKKRKVILKDTYNATIDPDGIKRNMLSDLERNKKILRCKNEINFINAIPNKKNKLKFLDLGCGPGHVGYAISKRFEKYGIDTSRRACNLALKYYNKIYCGTVEKKLLEKNFFDVVLCYHTIEHVQDPISMIKHVNKIMKPGGHLIIGTPDFDCAMARRYKKKFRLLSDPTHISLFSNDGLSKLLEHNGFTINYKDFPYFDESHFNKKDLMRVFDTSKVSPPFYGNILTFYCTKN